MNNDLIIVTNLGLLRAYREVKGQMDRASRLELIEEFKPEAAHEKLSEQLTDQSGRFPKGGGAGHVSGDLSAGERLNLESEQDRRVIVGLAQKINGLLADGEVARCRFAASAPVHKQLLDALEPEARAKISQVLASDLAKTAPSELLEHFKRAAA